MMHSSRGGLVVVGGVAAGISAASRARRLDPNLPITVFEREEEVFYDASSLPDFVAIDETNSEGAARVRRLDSLRRGMKIDIRSGHEVIEVDSRRKLVRYRLVGSDVVHSCSYDKLILATGARARRPPIPGMDLPGVFALRTLSDGLAIRRWLTQPKVFRAVVIGGGSVGVRMAEAFSRRNLEVTILEAGPHLLPFTEPVVARRLTEALRHNGINIKLNSPVTAVEVDPRAPLRRVVRTTGGGAFSADVVVVATGLEPVVELAEQVNATIGPTGAIAVDALQRTGIDGIWAAGDCCESQHRVHGEPTWNPVCTTANKQGRVAGSVVTGTQDWFRGVVGTSALRVFGWELARTGLTAAAASKHGFSPVVAVTTAPSRGHRQSGGGSILLALVTDARTERLLGAHMVGVDGVVLRINTFAAALQAGLRADEVAALDLAYTPSSAPVWDPILVASSLASRRAAAERVASGNGAVEGRNSRVSRAV